MKALKFLIAAAATAAVANAQATVVTYNDFSDTSGLTTVGNAAATTTADGKVMRLTPDNWSQSGAVYSSSAVQLGANATFSTTFQFRFTGNSQPADGMAFVLAASPNGLGVGGGGIGYQGVQNAFVIEFDTYDNGSWDGFSANHVGISTNGSTNTSWTSDVYQRKACFGLSTDTGCMSNGNLWTVKVEYDGALLSMSMRDETKSDDFLAYDKLAIDIASVLGTNQAYVGFTSATGAASQNHDLLNWTFADTAELPVDVPEPGSLWMLGLGMVGLAAGKRLGKQRV
ncbi:PEP-CTERM sorting domain-containing protein [Massilia sp. AB1]|uniref:lectin-like domain-containing protein n=1 Tax=Massilia sp. AB1 TaxID=2823371 RepID=UPI001B81196A|nr:PEP-CTERM sorting domain-containing protein [Massilia sp. AB1]MBQ5939618.1 PEP-CTERM sorting domain-containing protein [Massilia sp. AB1]